MDNCLLQNHFYDRISIQRDWFHTYRRKRYATHLLFNCLTYLPSLSPLPRQKVSVVHFKSSSKRSWWSANFEKEDSVLLTWRKCRLALLWILSLPPCQFAKEKSFNSFVCTHCKVLSYLFSLLVAFSFWLVTTKARKGQITWKGKVWNNSNSYLKKKKSLCPAIPTSILFQWQSISKVFWKIICFCWKTATQSSLSVKSWTLSNLKNIHSIFGLCRGWRVFQIMSHLSLSLECHYNISSVQLVMICSIFCKAYSHLILALGLQLLRYSTLALCPNVH